ncbi:MAG: hypothetical protein K1X36_05815 [Pyrinomonadaceae bacterium]|nr:hypothetical protein [Pyrinomonadaceae bacterium]
MKTLFFVCVLLSGCIAAAAQSKVVTNTDLDKYRAEREKAAADYRSNYAKRGMPSPEELAQRNERDRKESAELSFKMRGERLERERRESENRIIGVLPQERIPEVVLVNGYQTYVYPDHYYPAGQGRRSFQQPGYFAGGQFWPTGSATRVRPMWIRRR